MNKLKPSLRWIIAIFMLSLMEQSGTNSPYPFCFIAAGFWGIAFIVFVCLCLKYKYEPPQAPAAAAAPAPEPEPEPVSTPDTFPKWEDLHGRFATNIAGVTFANDDGTERQRILKDLYVNGAEGELALEPYDYKGTEAVAVLMNGDCIGNIPKHRLAEYSEIADRLERAILDVTVFTPDEDEFDDGSPKPERIYRADLTIIYKK